MELKVALLNPEAENNQALPETEELEEMKERMKATYNEVLLDKVSQHKYSCPDTGCRKTFKQA